MKKLFGTLLALALSPVAMAGFVCEVLRQAFLSGVWLVDDLAEFLDEGE